MRGHGAFYSQENILTGICTTKSLAELECIEMAHHRVKTTVVLCLAVCLPVLLVLWGVREHKIAIRVVCESNLRCIGGALQMYAQDNEGAFPPYDGATGLNMLVSQEYLVNPRVYVCPYPSKKRHVPATIGSPIREGNLSYIYMGGMSNTVPQSTPLAFLKPGPGVKYICVLFNEIYAKDRVKTYYGNFPNCLSVIEYLDTNGLITHHLRDHLKDKARIYDE
jgi:hypothetical protein